MAKRTPIDMSGLDTLGSVDLKELTGAGEPSSASAQAPAVSDGRPLEIPLEDIKEDPSQPRQFFDEQSLNEMSASIALFGVLMPISVRHDPEGGYIINAGARRYRGSKLAGKKTIPAFIQNAYDKYGQMAENIHRDNLKPLEIASFISEEVKNGKKKGDIAKALGKSPAFVSQYMKLAGAPDWIKGLSAQGVCSDVTTLTELIKVAEAGKVDNLEEKISGMEAISRADVQNLTRPAPAPQEAPGETLDTSSPGPLAQEITPSASPAPEAASQEGDQGSDDQGNSKAKKEKEPNLEKAVYVGGRKGYLQTKTVEMWWDDTGTFEKIPMKDLPPDALEE